MMRPLATRALLPVGPVQGGLLFVALLGLIGCSDTSINTNNSPPGVAILEPADGASVAEGRELSFVGSVTAGAALLVPSFRARRGLIARLPASQTDGADLDETRPPARSNSTRQRPADLVQLPPARSRPDVDRIPAAQSR